MKRSHSSDMDLAVRIMKTALHLEKAAQRIFHPIGLTPAQFNVLNVVSDQPEGVKLSDLAQLLLVDRSNVTGLVKRLKARGCLLEVATPGDLRQRRIRLSGKGRKIWEQAVVVYRRNLRRLERDLSDGERNRTDAVLLRLQTTAIEMASAAD
jgi:DNA-binding MarR family transcriptional regulator